MKKVQNFLAMTVMLVVTTGWAQTPTPTPSCTEDTWTATSLTNAPTGRYFHKAVWTGSEMIVWGGDNGNLLNTGGRYNPGTDSWLAMSTAGAPTGRDNHTAVWTGSEMMVWGGGDSNGGSNVNTGGKYNPLTNSWTATSTTNAPTAREYHTGVWTGSEMIVWGGYGLNTGGRYNPSTDSWIATSTTNAPAGRGLPTAVWTGTEMIVWGGVDGASTFNTGGRYDPGTDNWTATSTTNAPAGRFTHTAVWTGTEMIVWGGYNGNQATNTGGRYNPLTNSWTATSTTNAPAPREYHTAVWTGSEMIVWGGVENNGNTLNTGGRYNPGTDSWTAIGTSNAPIGRLVHTATWTGTEMMVWGGYDGTSTFDTGGRYCGLTLTTTPTPSPTPTITVSLPTDNFDTSVPGSTVIIEPVLTTLIDPTTTQGVNYVGFQGDFTFDSAVVGFGTPTAQGAGLTSTNWNIAASILNTGPGTTKTLRLSAFSIDFTPLNGSGTLFNLRMRRVSSTLGATSPLVWKAPPDNFFFIDEDLSSHAPNQNNGLITIGPACDLTQGFEDITTLVSVGWVMQNLSQPGPGATGWFQGSTAAFPAQSGAPNSYIGANYDNGTGTSTLSNWLLTPRLTLQNGATMTFWTRTVTTPFLPDRLQVRMSTNGASTNVGTTATSVGDFTTLLLDINPTYTLTGYPNAWTQFTVTVSGLGSPTTGRMAFRYFVENGGPNGVNSDYIGIDTVQYTCNQPPTPTPTPTPTPISISGAISYCANPVPDPVPNVTLTLTGSASGSTLSDGSGNYTLSSLPPGGTYTVTPSKAARVPGSTGINTVDVITTQRHFVSGIPLSPCQLTAADVNGDSSVNTIDVVAIQRFFLGLSTGIANVGKYQFIPANRTYTGIVGNQTGQNYDTIIFGDVASHFVEGPESPFRE